MEINYFAAILLSGGHGAVTVNLLEQVFVVDVAFTLNFTHSHIVPLRHIIVSIITRILIILTTDVKSYLGLSHFLAIVHQSLAQFSGLAFASVVVIKYFEGHAHRLFWVDLKPF